MASFLHTLGRFLPLATGRKRQERTFDFVRSESSHSEGKCPTNRLELHNGERPAQGLVGYLDRAVKWHIHVQYKVNRSRDEQG